MTDRIVAGGADERADGRRQLVEGRLTAPAPSAGDTVSVLVVDDSRVFRRGMARAVQIHRGLELVGEAGDGREALEAIRAGSPDVAVLDVEMPSLRGLDILEALRRDGVATRVVLLSAHLESDTVYEAVAGGVAAYLSKAAAGDRICEAIAAVARGEVILPAEVQAGLASEIRLRSESGRPALSPREREVLALIAEGLTAPAVGRELHLSAATVKSHLKTLYEKLGVSDRAAAVAEAMRRRLLE